MSAKPRIDFARLRREVNFLALLPADAKVRPCGANHWRARCPLHGGDGLSLGIWYGAYGWSFNCFACNEKGQVLEFLMKLEHISFKDAVARVSGQEMQGPAVALWPAEKKAFVLPCVGKGCGKTLAVDSADVPHLGLGLHNSWVFKRYDDGDVVGRCARCERDRLRDVGRMNTSGTEAGAGTTPAAGCREAGTGLADSPKTPRRPNA